MRGSIAEDQGIKINGRAESSVRAGVGYKLKPSEENGRSAMVGRRGNGQTWELRLGKLQVAVWLGLALGSIAGAYCVGFFAGRYVGFETARESTAVEVAKLPVTDSLPEGRAQNPSTIYEKLNAPAVLRETEEEAAAYRSHNSSREAPGAHKQPKLLQDSIERNDSVEEKKIGVKNSEQPEPAQAGGASVAEIEGLFDDSTGSELIVGSEADLAPQKVPQSVRMLGSSSTDGANNDKSASALLDERIANARTEATKSKEMARDAEVKAPVQDKKVTQSDSAVRKSVPNGFFAQVAAPKKLNEAEGIARKLKQSGFPVVIESATVGGQSFYRVLVGPEENKVQADRLVSQLRGESYIAGAPFIRQVK